MSADVLMKAGAEAARALTNWGPETAWQHELRVVEAPVPEHLGPHRTDYRSIGMDTYAQLSGTMILTGSEEAMAAGAGSVSSDAASDTDLGGDAESEGNATVAGPDAALLEIANVLGSAYLNGLRDHSGIESVDDRTFLPSPPSWHQVPLSVVFQLAMCGQGPVDAAFAAHHVLRSGEFEILFVWVPSVVALQSLDNENRSESRPETVLVQPDPPQDGSGAQHASALVSLA